MNSLYTALVNGQREFLEDGTERIVPPSSLDLHAARYIKQIDEINVGNNNILMQQQQHINDLLITIQNLQETNHGLQTTCTTLQNTLFKYESINAPDQTCNQDAASDLGADSSLLKAQGQAGQVGCIEPDPSGSDSDSQGRGTN